MKLSSKLHDAWQSFTFWIEGEWRYLKRYWPELRDWSLFAACLSLLCFLLGFMAGVALEK